MSDTATVTPNTLGHPNGLFMLFMSEMWERFSYYGMRALLVLYMIKGFLGYGDGQASIVYGAYTALVYMTPFFGGLLADRLLGPRRAVILGGLLMAAGHLVMTLEYSLPFFTALALLIIGNGFFKPNISTMVGGLYGEADPRRDAGFTIFYMGINLGAAAAPLLCGYIGETFGWHYGFGLATVGMLIGLAVFVIPSLIARFLVALGAITTAVAMVALQDNWLLLAVNGFVALCLAAAGVICFLAMSRTGLPEGTGDAPDLELLERPVMGVLSREHLVYIGSVLVVPAIAALVWINAEVVIVPQEILESLAASPSTLVQVGGNLLGEMSRPAGLLLTVIGAGALSYLLFEAVRATRIERHRLLVVLTLMVFSMLFWAFFEQAGTSVNLFTDRNVDRVFEDRVVQQDEIGTELAFTLTQEQLGYPAADGAPFTIDELDAARDAKRTAVTWPITEAHVGMGVGGTEVPTSSFQSANPIYILLFGPVFSLLWTLLGRIRFEPPTPVKFSLGLAQLGLGFGALWYGAATADTTGMVWLPWLLIGYLLHTTGELCISPVGLSMVTRLSPARLVSTTMGAWFLALAFSNYLAAVIAGFTGVGSHGGGDDGAIPVPLDTVDLYGGVFGTIAIAALISAAVVLLLSPLLIYGSHENELPGRIGAKGDGDPDGDGDGADVVDPTVNRA